MWRRETCKPGQTRYAVAEAKAKYNISERRACRAIRQHRSTHRYEVKKLPDEDELTARIINPVAQYGRYGTPRITAMLLREGFRVNHKRVERIWRQQGLKVPKKQKKKRRLCGVNPKTWTSTYLKPE